MIWYRVILFIALAVSVGCDSSIDVEPSVVIGDMMVDQTVEQSPNVSPDMFDMSNIPDMDMATECFDARACGLCSGQMAQLSQEVDEHLKLLTQGLLDTPIAKDMLEDTNGSIDLALTPTVFPVLSSTRGVFVAAGQLEQGRVVAFSGQDFLSSGDRSTLLDEEGVKGLLSNAVKWAGHQKAASEIKVLAPNDAVAAVLTSRGVPNVNVVALRSEQGLEKYFDWSAEALKDMDVAIVQVNEWGTLMLDDQDVPALRAFVKRGGGLLLATSAMHWSWWLDWTSERNPADMLLNEAGISFGRRSIKSTSEGRVTEESSRPVVLWCRYIEGESLSDSELSQVGPLFNAARTQTSDNEMEKALTRLIDETPPLPASRYNAKAIISASVASSLWGHTWPRPHPWSSTFPGEVKTPAEPKRRVDIDTTWKRARPLGVYAPPGQVVRVTVPVAHINKGLMIRVGDLHDQLRNIDTITTWRRAPDLFAERALTQEHLTIGTGVGGSVYLIVPDDYESTTISLEIDGGVSQPVYSHGITSVADFTEELSRSGAPQAIVEQVGKVRMVVPIDEARQVPRPNDVMVFWRGFYDSHVELSGEPEPRSYESHWLFDPQVGHGYANATVERINYPLLSVQWALRTRTGDEDWWLFAHELGHQFQSSDWIGGDITEVAVNLFSMFTINYYLNNGGDFDTLGFKDNMIDHASLKGMDWPTAGLFDRLEMYRQLVVVFGWPVFERVFESYYDVSYPRGAFGSYLDGFAIRFSAISGQDISGFLRQWNYPVSAEAQSLIDALHLPMWTPPDW